MEKKAKIALLSGLSLFCTILVVLVVLLVTLLPKESNSSSFPVVNTDCGPIEGRIFGTTKDDGTKQEVYEFLNIPYAVPPIGELRWRAPITPKQHGSCWKGTLPYKNEIVLCAQTKLDIGPVEVKGTEDCLILSVFTPSISNSTSLPVLVWIHPGGMVTGHGRPKGAYPDAEFTASMSVVSVSINYRLGILGFLTVEEFWGTTEGYGNYAIMDQILALKWVQKNIENFGGNPNDVTIFGHSGGGTGTYCLLSASMGAAKGLFHKVIASSGAPNVRQTYKDVNQQYRSFIDKTKCTRNTPSEVAACLRALELDTIFNNSPINALSLGTGDYEWIFPVNTPNKGVILQSLDPLIVQFPPTDIVNHLQTSNQTLNLDILMGNMAQEPITSVLPFVPVSWNSWDSLEKYLKPRVNSFANCPVKDLLALYKSRSHEKFSPANMSPYYVYSLLTSDVILSCATTRFAYNLSDHNSFNVYSYIVSQPLGGSGIASHSLDIFALFDFKATMGGTYAPTTEDQILRKNLREKFKAFIHTDGRFKELHRNRTMEFWNSTVHTWDQPYHQRECKFLKEYGFLKHSWGNRGIWDA